MSSLKERILQDRLVSLKSGDTVKRNLLSSLLGELDRTGKEHSDSDVIKCIKKMINSNIECNLELDNIHLECYLPVMLSRDELYGIIKVEMDDKSFDSIKCTGSIMSFLNGKYSGKFNGKDVSDIIKEILC